MHTRSLTVVDGTRPGGVAGTRLVRWFVRQAQTDGRADVRTVDAQADPGSFRDCIASSDAIVIVTPEYNHSFPGWLKSAIDALRVEWATRPVGFVTHGGRSGGLRAAEQLRLVFAELHAMTIRETLGFANAHEIFDDNGTAQDPNLDTAHQQFLDVLYWWADAVRAGHQIRDYPLTISRG